MHTPASPAATPLPPLQPPQAWWRIGTVWLMLGGPALVVVASVFTAVLAYRGQDTLVPPDAGPSAVPASIRHLPAEEAHERGPR